MGGLDRVARKGDDMATLESVSDAELRRMARVPIAAGAYARMALAVRACRGVRLSLDQADDIIGGDEAVQMCLLKEIERLRDGDYDHIIST